MPKKRCSCSLSLRRRQGAADSEVVIPDEVVGVDAQMTLDLRLGQADGGQPILDDAEAADDLARRNADDGVLALLGPAALGRV
ncbi:MAG: hypothetical protein Q8K43_02005, partial [Sulfurimicrobium sp.]|nr:hypothetical protein [Sulfurimicrobium sp.]